MMKWGRKKHVPSSSSSFSRAHLFSWFSMLSVSSYLKHAKEKKQDDEASQKMSAKSSLGCTERRNDVHESSKRLQKASVEKENNAIRSADMESNEKFKARETRGFLEVEAMERDKGTVIMTPRIQVKRDKKRFERRDQKLLKESGIIKVQKSATRSYSSREDIVKLKEIKLRQVKLKADQQRKSMYLRRELGAKGNSKVRVFSPRSCRVKAIEDLKKAKLRAREHDGGGISYAVVKCSSDPQKDFRDSMVEMIKENGIINQPEELKELLVCYLTLNTDEYHDMIINVFKQVQIGLSLNISFGVE